MGTPRDASPDSTEDIARHIARENWSEDQWRAYHPVVKQTVEWLQEHNYLVIVELATPYEGKPSGRTSEMSDG
jgi:hypothetical protein